MDGYLRFAYDEEGRDVIQESVYAGSWPPPDRLSLVFEIATGKTAMVDSAGVAILKDRFEDWSDRIVIQEFERGKTSTMSEDDLDKAAVPTVRGAVYTPIFEEVPVE